MVITVLLTTLEVYGACCTAKVKPDSLSEPEAPAHLANANAKDHQKSATPAKIAMFRPEMPKMKSDSFLEPGTHADTANVNVNIKVKSRQESVTAAEMTDVKSEMVKMKSDNLMEPGTPRGTASINTKDRQEPTTAAESTNVNSEMANVQSDGHLESKKLADMANVNAEDRQESATAAELANIKSEMARMKANNPTVPGTPVPESPASAMFGTVHVNSDVASRRHLETPTNVAETQLTNAAKTLPIPAVIELSSDSTESSTPTPPGAFKASSEESDCHQKLEAPAGVAETQSASVAGIQSANDTVQSGKTLPIPAVIVLSSDPAESPTPTPPGTPKVSSGQFECRQRPEAPASPAEIQSANNGMQSGTEERTIEVIELSSDPPEGASSTPSTSHNSKRLRANSPDSASKRPRGSPAAEAKLQKKAGPS
ncbi:hypothetical protein KC338_g1713 [Hortaea werneckii]|nr:hypothetical protein KC323_g2798 [Hortaea werneckii]KAI6873317.1 hypothetical protein KC338_g1713 [Hortaea werneckii]